MSNLDIYKVIVGPLSTNCYLIADKKTKETIILDPGDEPNKIITIIKENHLKPAVIVLTHAHYDHTEALEPIKNHFQVSVVQNSKELPLSNFKIIKTPGHAPDSICLVNEKEKSIFTGDTLFKNGIGRTDFPGGNEEQMKESLHLLMQFPDDFKIYPGHGPDSTIGQEKQ